MLNHETLSTYTLKRIACAEIRALARLGFPSKDFPTDRETYRAYHEDRLKAADAVLRARELGEAV